MMRSPQGIHSLLCPVPDVSRVRVRVRIRIQVRVTVCVDTSGQVWTHPFIDTFEDTAGQRQSGLWAQH